MLSMDKSKWDKKRVNDAANVHSHSLLSVTEIQSNSGFYFLALTERVKQKLASCANPVDFCIWFSNSFEALMPFEKINSRSSVS